MTKIKICGLRRVEDVEAVNRAGADFAGFVFAQSRRQVSPSLAAQLIARLKPEILPVGVFVNSAPEEIAAVVQQTGIRAVQLHGDETPQQMDRVRRLCPQVHLWRAVRVKSREDLLQADGLGADTLVLDSYHPTQYGGTGQVGNWDLISSVLLSTPVILAGGLDAGNLAQAVSQVRPMGVDLSGGVETGGVKDQKKIQQVVELAHRL